LKVVIIDDHPIFLSGLFNVLSSVEGIKIVGQANNLKSGINIVIREKPEIIIIDLLLGKENGLDMIARLKHSKINCKFIVLSCTPDLNQFKRAIELEVDGYLLKDILPEELISVLKTIEKDRKYFDPELVQMMLNKNNHNPLDMLTYREKQVLSHLSRGLKNKEIGEKLFVTEHTVKKHVGQILEKLDLTDRIQAALYAKDQIKNLSII
jgi:DNA-binding NarL/FixJ family response regulator